MREVLTHARRRFGRLDGVIHAAGSTGGATCAASGTERGRYERQLRPKLGGARAGAAAGGRRPDFVLLTSSLSRSWGLGFGAYAAANQALDAFAHERQRLGHPGWVSVGWMPGDSGAPRAGTGSESDRLAMSPEKGGGPRTRPRRAGGAADRGLDRRPRGAGPTVDGPSAVAAEAPTRAGPRITRGPTSIASSWPPRPPPSAEWPRSGPHSSE